jgi:hypothetical protein
MTRDASAQLFAAAKCVGDSVRCNQITFTFKTPFGRPPFTVDFFRIAITGGDFRFAPAQPGTAKYGLGDTVFVPTVSSGGTVLSGTFEPALEVLALNPFLQILAQLEPNTHGDSGPLSWSYQASVNGQTIFEGVVMAAPEPGSLVLLGTGLIAVAGIGVRRRVV